jgi:hypothetical protein
VRTPNPAMAFQFLFVKLIVNSLISALSANMSVVGLVYSTYSAISEQMKSIESVSIISLAMAYRMYDYREIELIYFTRIA